MTSVQPTMTAVPQARRGLVGWRHYTLLLLSIVAVFNYIDRQILSILLEPVKKDLGASDTEMGLLNGLAFAVFYVVAGIPLARWADRGVRRDIVSACLGVWSAMTMLCGSVQNFWQLAALRMGVAGGEAGAAPATQSMIADIYPRDQRGTAIGVWVSSQSLGIAFGMIFGGWLVTQFGWRIAFLIVGLPGALLALIFRFTVREPERQRDSAADRPSNVWATFRELWAIPSYRAGLLVAASVSFTGYAILTWTPSFFIRVHHMPTTTVGLLLGLSTALGLIFGNMIAGRLTDMFVRRSVTAYLWIPLVGGALSVPFGLLTTLSPSSTVAMISFFVLKLTMTAWNVPIYAATMSLARPSQRATSVLIVTITTNLAGLGLGTFTVGRLNDMLHPRFGDGAIAWSLSIVMSGLAVSCLIAAWGLRHIRRDFERVAGGC